MTTIHGLWKRRARRAVRWGPFFHLLRLRRTVRSRTRAISCNPYPSAVGAQQTLTLQGFDRRESIRLRFYRELDGCGGGRPCWTWLYNLALTMDNSGRATYVWDTSNEQPGTYRLCINSLGNCQYSYVEDQLTPADVSTPGAYGPDTCQQGYVWREAVALDHVCVTPDVRTQTARDNSLASSRKTYGPGTCVQGFVWREARAGDQICVKPRVRAQTTDDNAQADARRDPNGGPYGPDTCKQGFVWRDAFANDHVCVTPVVRSQAADDNSQAAQRIDQTAGPPLYGPDTCRQGLVWREATPEDHVCVTVDVRSQARYDNAQAPYRVLN